MPPANRAGDQFDTLVVVRHKPVLEDSLKPSRLCRLSGRNGGQFSHQGAIQALACRVIAWEGGIILKPNGDGVTNTKTNGTVDVGKYQINLSAVTCVTWPGSASTRSLRKATRPMRSISTRTAAQATGAPHKRAGEGKRAC